MGAREGDTRGERECLHGRPPKIVSCPLSNYLTAVAYPLRVSPRVCPFSLSSTTSKRLLRRLELNEPWLGKGLMSFCYTYYEVVWKNESKLVHKSKLSHRGIRHNPRGSSTAGFKWQRWSNGGKNENPTKSLDQNLTPPPQKKKILCRIS